MKCALSKEVNSCPFCNKEDMLCKNDKRCAFQDDGTDNKENRYVRKERWYEKYYKGDK